MPVALATKEDDGRVDASLKARGRDRGFLFWVYLVPLF